jgi:phage nucleotide-binding protein
MKILNTKDLENHYVKTLVYGESGAGKTTLAGTLDTKTIVISAESGLLSVAGKDIDYIDLQTDDKGQAITDPQLRLARLAEIFKWLQAGTNYKNVFLDSLTEISEIMVSSLNKEFPDRKDSLVLYGENAKRMRGVIKSFRDLQYNVYMTCVAKPEKDESGRRFHGFQITGKIGATLPQYFDQVYYLRSDAEGKRMIMTRKTDVIVGKDRSNKLGAEEPADLGAIYKKIMIDEKNEKKEKAK